MQEMLIADVEIISMLILFSASTWNIFAAIPWWERIPEPTIETRAILLSKRTSPARIFWATALAAWMALGRSLFKTVKEISVSLVWLTFCTIISTLTSILEMSVNILAAIPVWSGTAQMVIFA